MSLHASVRRYRVPPDRIDEVTRLADTALADRLAAVPGFVSYDLMATDDGRLCSMTIFEDRHGAERSQEIAAEFVRINLFGVEIERLETITGEVMVSRSRGDAAEAGRG